MKDNSESNKDNLNQLIEMLDKNKKHKDVLIDTIYYNNDS